MDNYDAGGVTTVTVHAERGGTRASGTGGLGWEPGHEFIESKISARPVSEEYKP